MKIDRREFLKSASIATMLGMFAPNLLLGRIKSTPPVIKDDGEEVLSGNVLRINSKDVGVLNSVSVDTYKDEIDVTALDDSSGYRDFITGHNTSEVSMSLAPTPRVMSVFSRGFEPGKLLDFELITGGVQFIFQGYIIKTVISAEEAVMKVSIDTSITVT